MDKHKVAVEPLPQQQSRLEEVHGSKTLHPRGMMTWEAVLDMTYITIKLHVEM